MYYTKVQNDTSRNGCTNNLQNVLAQTNFITQAANCEIIVKFVRKVSICTQYIEGENEIIIVDVK